MSTLLIENSATMHKDWAEDSRLKQLNNPEVTKLLITKSSERKLRKDKVFYDLAAPSNKSDSETSLKKRLSYEVPNN